jgi:hypothetical protein
VFPEIAASSESIVVPAATLSEVIALAGGHVDLLKIDIEGQEIPILGGLRGSEAAAVGQISVEFHDFVQGFAEAATTSSVLRLTRRLGYTPLVLSSCRLDHSDVLLVKTTRPDRSVWRHRPALLLLMATLRLEWLVARCRKAFRELSPRGAS